MMKHNQSLHDWKQTMVHNNHVFKRSLYHDIKLLARIEFEACLVKDLAQRVKPAKIKGREISNIKYLNNFTCLLKDL